MVEVFSERPKARVLLEASTESEWVARLLEEVGHEVIVADPNYAPMYAQRSRRVKTDRRDALALAEACRQGTYRPAHRTSDPRRHMRGLLSVREGLVRTRTRLILLTRSLLRREGTRVRSGHAESFALRVKELRLPDYLLLETEPILELLAPLNAQIDVLDRRIEKMVQEDQTARRLTMVPGVGSVVALAFVATLDTAARFRGAHQVESYLGLVPREWSSGEIQRRGHVTKSGNSRMRWLLVQSAQALMRTARRPETAVLREWAERIAVRRGRRIAAVALARRLAGILYAMWRDGTEYKAEKLHAAPSERHAA
jgi:transposase